MKPFDLKEVNHTEEGWEPDVTLEYLVQYRWPSDSCSRFLVGRFSKQWYGYTFNWYWGSNSIQLSTEAYSKDIESFIGIWKVIRLPEPDRRGKQVNLITQEEMII